MTRAPDVFGLPTEASAEASDAIARRARAEEMAARIKSKALLDEEEIRWVLGLSPADRLPAGLPSVRVGSHASSHAAYELAAVQRWIAAQPRTGGSATAGRPGALVPARASRPPQASAPTPPKRPAPRPAPPPPRREEPMATTKTKKKTMDRAAAIETLRGIGSGKTPGYSEADRRDCREQLRAIGINVSVVPHSSLDGTRMSLHPARSAEDVAIDDFRAKYGYGGGR